MVCLTVFIATSHSDFVTYSFSFTFNLSSVQPSILHGRIGLKWLMVPSLWCFIILTKLFTTIVFSKKILKKMLQIHVKISYVKP